MRLRILKDNQLPSVPATPVEKITPELRMLAAHMLAAMKMANGVGLAAPQVGENIRLLVFDCVDITFNAFDSAFMFNPELLEAGMEETIAKEGCLSFPGQFVDVKRNKEIKVKYIDISGKTMVRSYKGLAARVILHELDHLDGITMLQREEK